MIICQSDKGNLMLHVTRPVSTHPLSGYYSYPEQQHCPVVATYATVDHQALTPGIAARVSLKKITLVSWTRGRGLYFTCFVSLLVCIFWSALLIFNGWMLEAASSVRAVGRV